MAGIKYPHSDHRRRVREAFRKTDISEVPDRALLELLLFYSVPRKDTNQTAENLLAEYGSLKEILRVPFDELKKTDGIGESSALLLSILPEIAERYSGKPSPKIPAFERGEAQDYVMKLFEKSENEKFYLICLDALGRAICCNLLGEGDVTRVTVDKKSVVRAALDSDADSVILTHNHPRGVAAPSEKDIILTNEIHRLLNEIGIKLIDHIIAGTDGCLSLRATYKFQNYFD